MIPSKTTALVRLALVVAAEIMVCILFDVFLTVICYDECGIESRFYLELLKPVKDSAQKRG
jgi:hypothetical protein